MQESKFQALRQLLSLFDWGRVNRKYSDHTAEMNNISEAEKIDREILSQKENVNDRAYAERLVALSKSLRSRPDAVLRHAKQLDKLARLLAAAESFISADDARILANQKSDARSLDAQIAALAAENNTVARCDKIDAINKKIAATPANVKNKCEKLGVLAELTSALSKLRKAAEFDEKINLVSKTSRSASWIELVRSLAKEKDALASQIKSMLTVSKVLDGLVKEAADLELEYEYVKYMNTVKPLFDVTAPARNTEWCNKVISGYENRPTFRSDIVAKFKDFSTSYDATYKAALNRRNDIEESIAEKYRKAISDPRQFETVFELDKERAAVLAIIRARISDFERKWSSCIDSAANEAEKRGIENYKLKSPLCVRALTYAADRGYPNANYYLGLAYINAVGASADYAKALEHFEFASRAGIEDAKYQLAWLYYDGKGTAKNAAKACSLFIELTKHNNPGAYRMAGRCYSSGEGVARDVYAGFKYSLKGAELGDALAQYDTACAYECGSGTAASNDKALEWYDKSAKQGCTEAKNAAVNLRYEIHKAEEARRRQEELNDCIVKKYRDAIANPAAYDAVIELDASRNTHSALLNSRITGFESAWEKCISAAAVQAEKRGIEYYNQRSSLAIKPLTFAVNAGLVNANYYLGCCYYSGVCGVSNDDAAAAKYFKVAANADVSDAQFLLAVLYHEGRGVTKDLYKAFSLFLSASKKNHATATAWVGYCYLNGYGVTKDYSLAFEFNKKGAELGDVTAQYNVGGDYEEGRGTSVNRTKALEWYDKAAGRGHKDAAKNASAIRAKIKAEEDERRRQKEIDDLNANINKWFDAAQAGDAYGQLKIGECFLNGTGVDRNYELALDFLKKSADGGNKKAMELIGDCYNYGWGVAASGKTAVYWYKKAGLDT